MPPDKITKAEFVKRIKAKYPVYKDMPDNDLFDKIIAKYYKDQISDLGGVEKKNGNGTGLSNGQLQPSEPTTSQLPEDEYSGKRPSEYPLPQSQPQQKGFKTEINLGEPQPPQPQVQKKPLDVLSNDYYAHKVDIDKSLTSTVGDNPEFGQYVPNDSLLKSMVDTRSPDNKLLEKYSKKRTRDFDNEFQTRKAALDEKYPAQQVGLALPYSAPHYDRPPEYYEELGKLNGEIDTKKNDILDAVRVIASNKLAFLGDTKKIGREVRRAIGDPTLAREERYERKGIPLSPSENYYNDKAGFIAQATALKELDDNGVDILNNPQAKKLLQSVKEGKAKLFADHKDFTKQQAANLISDEISRDKNWLQLMTGAYTINDKDIKKYAEKLGIPDSIANLVHDSDIKTSNVFGEFMNELAARPGANIGTFIGRPFRREVLGQDPDAIDAHYEALNKKFTTFLAESPDAQAAFSNPTEIQKDPTQENYLEDQRNLKQGKFNWNAASIANSIANGAGQMIQYGIGGTAVGGALTGVNKLLKTASSVEKAKNVGLVTYGFLNSYEQGYQQARGLVGDDPKDEAKRNVVAALQAGVQAFSELVFPDYKVTDKLFSVKNSGAKILLDQLEKYGPKALERVATKKAFSTAIMNGLVKTGTNTLKEIGEEEAAIIGDVVISSISNPKSLDQRDIPQEFLQTAITTGISSLIPIGLAEMRQTNHTSGVNKSFVHEIGFDPQTYIAHISAEAADGKMSDAVANRKIAIVNTMTDIVRKEVPEISPVNNKPLSEMDKINYSYNLLHQKLLTERLDNTTDEVQQGIIEKQIKDLKAEREGILLNADGIEKNFDGNPIFDRDIDITPLEDKEVNKIIEDARTAKQLGVYENLSNEDLLKNVAMQAQNVQQDGTVSNLITGRQAYDQTVRNFGDNKDLVNAAIAKHPVESLIKPVEEVIPNRNDDFVNKYFKEGTPEREEFEKLDETGQDKMIADKREELRKFATPTEEIKKEEPVPPVVEKEPAKEEPVYRTEAEANELLSDFILDEKGEPTKVKRVPFVKNYKNDVKYHDIVTGETKTEKVHRAKEEMVKRYNKLQDLIVNCL